MTARDVLRWATQGAAEAMTFLAKRLRRLAYGLLVAHLRAPPPPFAAPHLMFWLG